MPSIMVIPFYFHQGFNLLLCFISRGREGADMTVYNLVYQKVLSGRRTKKPAGSSDTLNAVEIHLSEFQITYTVGANFCSIIILCG